MFSLLWNSVIIDPMLNALLWLYGALGNFVLAIAIFTIITRIIMLPLNLRQQRSMAKTQEMQPQIRAIQQKYKDNPQKMQEEFARIGYNPAESLSGCLPLIATMPILFGLFAVLRIVLGTTPLALLEMTQRAYPFIDLTALLPIDSQFLWMNLGQPDPFYVLPVLVFVTTFIQTKVSTPPKPKNNGQADKKGKQQQQDDPTAAMTQSMQYTMPLMFGFFALTFQAGLSIYFILSNLIGIGQGYYTRKVMEKEKAAREETKKAVELEAANGDGSANGRVTTESAAEDEVTTPPPSKGTPPPAKRKKKKNK
ncbi:MAG TPA: YidC/Oxa1 family membrane protein insertase [Chloroflexota bacterium]|nr:YidC/Oxa1 family membrane protein insertase [Chloroflexota bacterium]HUM71730.1 YidC/Oxa1 family membrane protein insertase [Chloroflexota bacterium]